MYIAFSSFSVNISIFVLLQFIRFIGKLMAIRLNALIE